MSKEVPPAELARAAAAEAEATEVADVIVAALAIAELPPKLELTGPTTLVSDPEPASDPELLLGVLSKLFKPVLRPPGSEEGPEAVMIIGPLLGVPIAEEIEPISVRLRLAGESEVVIETEGTNP